MFTGSQEKVKPDKGKKYSQVSPLLLQGQQGQWDLEDPGKKQNNDMLTQSSANEKIKDCSFQNGFEEGFLPCYLTVSPLSPCLPVGPTGPGAPGEPGAP